MFNYSEIKFNKNEKRLTLSNNQEIYNFTSDKGIKFAFQWNSFDDTPINQSVGTIRIFQYYFYDCIDEYTSCKDEHEISLVPCNTNDIFKGIVNNRSFTLLCPSNETELTLQSDVFGDETRFVTADIEV